jgi:threonine/homoserine/homoserine lactone efflux protein
MVTPAFVATSIIILLTPGPTNTVLAASGAAMGLRRGIIMPLAEAIGYVIAISFFVVFAQYIRGNPTAFFMVKVIASVWLAYTAFRLWTSVAEIHFQSTVDSFLRILITTILNPKAMLVGIILIPAETAGQPYLWIATYAGLSIFAGMGWVLLGSSMPLGIRLHSYKLASVVLGFFSITAVASAFSA